MFAGSARCLAEDAPQLTAELAVDGWQGIEHELVIYPREGHRLAERNHQLDLLRRTRAWFERWLRNGGLDCTSNNAQGDS
jgi:dipeptidyl aminopeptidase/acylaminoacyl peptidase